ncbi:hypothetical protein CDL12_05838 [Handroanthus impetiginosus]|uniref:Transcription factor, Myb superfamily n=1 Tax=Handroanthus impetiginosus TaxID=429701 RepID=A0A2G9HVC5_9LAMI|nr:hypothetical protein CDL12_17115 [Handroanthus impetiginosus]PIN21464.1 hypothetical protein CDL12_05838 [Handroanthus impetiginosus]
MQEVELRKGPWLEDEDEKLAAVVALLGERRWDSLAKASGLRRSGKSCRLRWMNYLRPNLKHGKISKEEEKVIIELHKKWGNKWSRIAQRLPGRTDNEIKNYWRSYSKKKAVVLEKECLSSSVNTPCSISDESFLIKDDVLGLSDDASDALEPLNWTRSPYETRLSEWMSNWPPDTRKTDKLWDYEVYSSQWIFDECNIGTWDDLSLWDGE